MKLVHLSDLHLGKVVHGFSMLEDQKDILIKIINIIDEAKPDGVIIAGDIYDKGIPPVEAVNLFDDFLNKLMKRKLQVYAISGNHDSADRMAFGSRIMDSAGIHFSPLYDGNVTPITFEDEYGKVNIYMLPFVRPINVKTAYTDEEIDGFDTAIKVAVEHMTVDSNERNVIITHQTIVGATRCESEKDLTIGGTEAINAHLFDAFDYVALGHLHGPQDIVKDKIRYCGTPLKYSFSEADHTKSVTVVELKEKGNIIVDTKELIPLHNMRQIRGGFAQIVEKGKAEGEREREDYISVILTDEDDIPSAMEKLRVVYPNVMTLDYDNTRTRSASQIVAAHNVDEKTPLELFQEFFKEQNGQDMKAEQFEYMTAMIESIWEE